MGLQCAVLWLPLPPPTQKTSELNNGHRNPDNSMFLPQGALHLLNIPRHQSFLHKIKPLIDQLKQGRSNCLFWLVLQFLAMFALTGGFWGEDLQVISHVCTDPRGEAGRRPHPLDRQQPVSELWFSSTVWRSDSSHCHSSQLTRGELNFTSDNFCKLTSGSLISVDSKTFYAHERNCNKQSEII